jgi:cytochrome c2
MSRYRKIFNRIFTSIFLVVLLSINNQSLAADGAALFKANCASCHKIDKDFTGPALKGWKDRVPAGDWFYKWIELTSLRETDAYAKDLWNKWGKAQMTALATNRKRM